MAPQRRQVQRVRIVTPFPLIWLPANRDPFGSLFPNQLFFTVLPTIGLQKLSVAQSSSLLFYKRSRYLDTRGRIAMLRKCRKVSLGSFLNKKRVGRDKYE
ncbi:hypothetical protein CDAR_263431 [Caerostris darwini]|uniref:Uncharacterized protein n=1 Tax=Caerostris darwini TaxID=1538125 RepID=A0AAV4RZT0_9ARAC|nr:hypothetical protein CDAR_263431 [Caerostris darwini]